VPFDKPSLALQKMTHSAAANATEEAMSLIQQAHIRNKFSKDHNVIGST